MTDDKKRLVIFFIITAIFMVFWQVWYVNPQLEARKKWEEEQKLQSESEGLTLDKVLSGKAAKDNGSVAVNVEETAQAVINQKAQDLAPAKRIQIQSPTVKGSFSLRGLRFDDAVLPEFRQALDKSSPAEVLLSPIGKKESYFLELGWLAADETKVPNAQSLWQSDKEVLKPGGNITLTWNNGAGLLFKRVMTLDEHYLFTVVDSVENTGNSSANLIPYGRINRARSDAQAMYISHEGPLTVLDEVLEEVTYGDLKDDGKHEFIKGHGWLGMADKYWLTAILPSPEDAITVKSIYSESKHENRYQIDYTGDWQEVAPGTSTQVTRHVFVGAKKVKLLDEYGENLGVPLFDRAVDYGWLYFLTKPMFAVLSMFYHLIGNFGLAILSLTVVVKLLLFPLASKGYRSMARMRTIMPEMTQIKERYKDDRVKLNQEMMDLYKRHKVNPAAGCLPVFLQLPVFFALYKVLYVSIEMRHAPFYGWIHDLSAPDPTDIFNLFGLLPYDVVSWLPVIGAWPIIYAVTMYIQQALNPPPSDPSQALVMKLLPLLFLFLFASFPAGLVIYWVWNNILSIIQQYIINRSINKTSEKKLSTS